MMYMYIVYLKSFEFILKTTKVGERELSRTYLLGTFI